ncbi:MAG: tRNA 2-thiouridine(34) synthase MnmA [Acidobacteriota bacterium]
MNVALLLSGGVDSSVALKLLLEAGHDVTAFYLKIWLEDELAHLGECPWEDDLRCAREVCSEAGVPLEVVSLQREYHQQVVRWAIDELRAGRTPSPDVLCNRRIKFGAFVGGLETQTRRPAFDRVASGHYARTRQAEDGVELLKGVDPIKDQTYFLFRLEQSQLRRCLFPLGGYHKTEVRHLAQRFELPNRARKDSQGICFLGKIPYDDFVRSHLGEQPGEIREIESERRLGEHRGYWFHTIGQRRGLGLGGGPWYVVRKDVHTNVVYVSHREALTQHSGDRFLLPQVHWIHRPPEARNLSVKLRHGPTTYPCRTKAHPSGGCEIQLDGHDSGIADGQMAVLYDGEVCLGGGMISR